VSKLYVNAAKVICRALLFELCHLFVNRIFDPSLCSAYHDRPLSAQRGLRFALNSDALCQIGAKFHWTIRGVLAPQGMMQATPKVNLACPSACVAATGNYYR